MALNGGNWSLMWQAPVHSFLIWTLLREIAPDHEWEALIGALVTGIWVLLGGPTLAGLAIGGLMLAGRLVLGSVGRRPLPTDVAAIAVGASAIAHTAEGWVAGFGLGVALFVEDHMSDQSRPSQQWGAAGAAAGATIVAALTDVLPQTLTNIDPGRAVVAVILALILIGRDPAPPTTRVDARHAALIRVDRLHATRSLVGILVVATALVVGARAEGIAPILAAFLIAVITNEIRRA